MIHETVKTLTCHIVCQAKNVIIILYTRKEKVIAHLQTVLILI